jgi:hypothetical protein
MAVRRDVLRARLVVRKLRWSLLVVVTVGASALGLSGCPSARQSLPQYDAGSAETAGGPPADGGVDGDVDASSDTAPNGTTCVSNGDCAFGHCVGGICCDGACASKCTSCRNSDTGQLDGKCAAVKSGLVHATDCTASAATTCGLDGKCDGAGACRYWASGTDCATESCTDGAGASNYSSARTCDGSGTCGSAMTSTCGGTFRCSGTECRTTCSTATDCIQAAYCSSSGCMRKKAEGAVCAGDTECLDGVCGGRCCAAHCTCTQASATNVLKNPGIDQDTSGWSVDVGTLTRALSDIDRCPYSGSLNVTVRAGGDRVTLVQCAGNTPLLGLYNYGAHIRNDGPVISNAFCQASFFSGFACDGDLVGDDETNGLMVQPSWQETTEETGGTGIQVEGANSVRFSCFLSSDPSMDVAYYLDQMFVSKDPDHF